MRLSEAEKTLLKALIDADEPLPLEFRERLFPPSTVVELGWQGKHGALPAREGDIPALRESERYGDAVDGWRDRLILGDNTEIVRSLRDGPLRAEIEAVGGLRMIYLDPPFLTGRSFFVDVPVGAPRAGVQDMVSLPAYSDGATGGLSAYLDAMLTPIRLMHDLLAEDGSLYFHCDHRVSAAMRLVLDEVFGPDRLLNEIVWHYGLGNPGGKRAFARKHDTILLYTKSSRYTFNRLRGDVTPAMAAKYRHQDENGRYLVSYGKKYYLKGGKPLDTVWSIPTLGATDGQRTGYPTQKPEALLERMVLASSNPGDLVADFCCGSGTLAAVAARLDRRWIACDASPRAIQTTRARLLASGHTGLDVLEVVGAARQPLPLEYDAVVDAVAERAGDQVVVRLTGYRPVARGGVAAASGLRIEGGHLVRTRRTGNGANERASDLLTDHWSDWVEGWAVGFKPIVEDAIPDPFAPAWWFGRTGDGRPLVLASPPLPVPPDGRYGIVVKVVDALGEETYADVAL